MLQWHKIGFDLLYNSKELKLQHSTSIDGDTQSYPFLNLIDCTGRLLFIFDAQRDIQNVGWCMHHTTMPLCIDKSTS